MLAYWPTSRQVSDLLARTSQAAGTIFRLSRSGGRYCAGQNTAGLSHALTLRLLSGEGDNLVGLRNVADDALREARVEFVGVFFCEEIRNVLFGFFEGSTL